MRIDHVVHRFFDVRPEEMIGPEIAGDRPEHQKPEVDALGFGGDIVIEDVVSGRTVVFVDGFAAGAAHFRIL